MLHTHVASKIKIRMRWMMLMLMKCNAIKEAKHLRCYIWVPQSKPHVRPSPLQSIGTARPSWLHLVVGYRLRAPHLHNTSQETYRTQGFCQGRVSHHSTYFVNHIDNHSSQNKHIRVLVNLVFVISPLMSALSTPIHEQLEQKKKKKRKTRSSTKWPKTKEKPKPGHLKWAKTWSPKTWATARRNQVKQS
jgi:hypothetical protein